MQELMEALDNMSEEEFAEVIFGLMDNISDAGKLEVMFDQAKNRCEYFPEDIVARMKEKMNRRGISKDELETPEFIRLTFETSCEICLDICIDEDMNIEEKPAEDHIIGYGKVRSDNPELSEMLGNL